MAAQALSDALNKVPYLATLGITVEQAKPGEVALMMAPGTTNTNHTGGLHSSALFGLGEAAAGIAIGTHPDLASYGHLQKATGIKYVARATGPVLARARIDDTFIGQVRGGLRNKARTEADVIVAIEDGSGTPIAEVVSVYTFRTR
jgi:acyl-coenzyme A thioesterase PaaI-like protein